MKRLAALLLTAVMALSLTAFAPALAAEDDPLIFDPEAAYQGEYTTTYDGKEVQFKVYQATYVQNPITGYSWGRVGSEAPSEDFFKLTINVPVRYDGTAFDENAVRAAPIMFFIPWSGDGGSAAPAPGTFIKKGQVMTSRALAEGWVVVEPGMRGSNCTVGTVDTKDYYNYGKLPYPIVDLKAAVRYLRNGDNLTTIPGNKDLIFATSSSSGGCGTVMLGSSANNAFFEPYLEELGAADTSDAIFCAAPSCPVMDRGWGDVAIAWELWGDLTGNDDADPYNIAMTAAFPDYLEQLALKAEFAVDVDGDGIMDIKKGDALTAENYAGYLMAYVRQSAVRYLNQLGGKEKIDEYLASVRPADRYGSGEEERTWIDPIYKPGTETVVDIGGTWEEFWSYCYGSNQIDPSIELNWQYDKTLTCPALQENGVVTYAGSNIKDGDTTISYTNLSSASFGKANDYAAVLSAAGQDWIRTERKINISQEYLDLIELQGNSVNPLYFIADASAGASDICEHWFMRTGATDLVTPHPLFFALATVLQNQGKHVDAALMWDEMHQVTSDQDAFFAFADELIGSAPSKSENDPLIFNPKTAYQGEYTISDNEQFPGTIVFKTYQATYAANPITGLTWGNAPSEDYFKLNVKVPVSYNGAVFDEKAVASAPILFYNPWGGDAGRPVGDPGALSARGGTVDTLVGRALSQGWVVVEPGMRGAANCFVGTPDEEGYINYGKLPYPIADLKAAIRYLRYETNASIIPGNKEQIFVAGSSSGGSATVMLGSSGNSPFFDPYLEEIGAAPGRDDIFAALPSCPVMIRAWGDTAIAWERWGDLSGVEDANEINAALSQAFIDYQAGLGIKAEFDVGDTIKKGDLLTADNYVDYLMVYLKESALKYLNSLGGREEIEAYLAEDLAANSMYGTPDASRDWIKPVYDGENPDRVVDIEGTWSEFWAYVVGEEHFNSANLLDMQYDRPLNAPNEAMVGNGIVNSVIGDRYSPYANASSFSFGKADEYAAVFTNFGQDWIREQRNIAISQEYLDLIEMQRNSVDPLYFIIGDGAKDATVCPNWCMRTGSVDLVVPTPLFVNLATALENQGKNVDAALVWDQKHGLTSDLDGFFAFAAELVDPVPAQKPAPAFSDVSEGDWYYDAACYVSENGLMNGTGGRFNAADGLSRGMLAQILYNRAGQPAVETKASFSDVAEDSWYADAVAWAAEAGIVNGYDGGRFGPEDSVTREQLALMLHRYADAPDSSQSLDGFSDGAAASAYALPAMRWAVEQGIVTGSGHTLAPQGSATRAEAAAMLMRFCTAYPV